MMEEKRHIMGNEIEVVVMRKFGDEQSSLLDKFERLSFEVQLNQAMLGRSLSEPGAMVRAKLLPPPPLVSQVLQGRRRRSGLRKVLKKLLKPIVGRKTGTSTARSTTTNNINKKQVPPDPRDPSFWKSFSRSLRL